MNALAELLRRVQVLELEARRNAAGFLAGDYQTSVRGRGMLFAETRKYVHGDPVRSIDWNVTARAGQPFIKLFQEERELTVILLVDASASLFFGSTSQTKHELVTELAATLAFSAIKNQDKVGLTLFSEQVEYSLPPRKGVNDVLRLIRTLLLHRPEKQGTNLRVVLEHLNRTVKRRSVVFLLSDFQDSNFEKPLRIAARRHDLIPIVVSDDREKTLPPVGLLPLRDAESGAIRWFDTSSRRHRFLFTRAVEKREQNRENLFKKLGLRSIQLSTGQDYVEALQRFFRSREKRA